LEKCVQSLCKKGKEEGMREEISKLKNELKKMGRGTKNTGRK
jgi:hypothetical protein